MTGLHENLTMRSTEKVGSIYFEIGLKQMSVPLH
jgi:hypothetical protein